MPHPSTEPDLLEAYRRQLACMTPGIVFLAWQGQTGIHPDDLIDEFKAAESREAAR